MGRNHIRAGQPVAGGDLEGIRHDGGVPASREAIVAVTVAYRIIRVVLSLGSNHQRRCLHREPGWLLGSAWPTGLDGQSMVAEWRLGEEVGGGGGFWSKGPSQRPPFHPTKVVFVCVHEKERKNWAGLPSYSFKDLVQQTERPKGAKRSLPHAHTRTLLEHNLAPPMEGGWLRPWLLACKGSKSPLIYSNKCQ